MSMVNELQGSHSVKTLCEAFELSRSTMTYRRKAAKQVNPETIKLNALVKKAHTLSHGSSGARTIASIVSNWGERLLVIGREALCSV